MATSGSFDFGMTTTQIIARAWRLCRRKEEGESVPTWAEVNGRQILNAYVKHLQNRGVFLWTLEQKIKTLTASSEVLGTEATPLNYDCILAHTAAAANRPITGAEWPMYWYQRGSSGSTWVTSTAYTSIGDFLLPVEALAIERAKIRYNDVDHDLKLESFRGDYFDIANKTQTGQPVKMFIQKQLSQNKVLLWPIPNTTDYVLHYLQTRKLEDFDASLNDPDMKSKWLDVLCFGLAARWAPELALPRDERMELKEDAERFLLEAKAGDYESEEASFISNN